MNSAVVSDDCWCVDLCNRDARPILEFVRRSRGVVVSSPTSPWFGYFDAVYRGFAPRPFELWRVDTFYQNTLLWRQTYPARPNPFRDCHGQRRCGDRVCSLWWEELIPQGAELADDHVGVIFWPTWLNLWEHQYFHVCQLVSLSTNELGHATYPNNTWIEVLRSDARPMFQEGAVPPECYKHGQNPFKLGEPRPFLGFLPTCYERFASMGGGQPFLPGCWARPAVGSGIWVNTGVTHFPSSITEITLTILKSASLGIDTLQFEFGDKTPASVPPWREPELLSPGLIIFIHKECIGRTDGIHACIPGAKLLSGWHNLPCGCVDGEFNYPAWTDDASKHMFKTQYEHMFVVQMRNLPLNGELPKSSGLLNCQDHTVLPPRLPAPNVPPPPSSFSRVQSTPSRPPPAAPSPFAPEPISPFFPRLVPSTTARNDELAIIRPDAGSAQAGPSMQLAFLWSVYEAVGFQEPEQIAFVVIALCVFCATYLCTLCLIRASRRVVRYSSVSRLEQCQAEDKYPTAKDEVPARMNVAQNQLYSEQHINASSTGDAEL